MNKNIVPTFEFTLPSEEIKTVLRERNETLIAKSLIQDNYGGIHYSRNHCVLQLPSKTELILLGKALKNEIQSCLNNQKGEIQVIGQLHTFTMSEEDRGSYKTYRFDVTPEYFFVRSTNTSNLIELTYDTNVYLVKAHHVLAAIDNAIRN